ncbi:hypothetical protein [Desulfatiglans anilini]|uniref:hypothetical protein n=1 Tax=Desulfatiglans anilini TaxID=90728 RepID=UPI0004007B49|nr:hypothetical protein [Desulfatiglans anilini]
MKGVLKPLWWLAFLTVILSGAACGKKGPPFLPKAPFTLVVTQPEAVWHQGVLTLTGEVLTQERQPHPGQVAGCRVYYAHFALDAAPCEGCPVSYHGYREIRGTVVKGEIFESRVNIHPSPGVHYLEIRLIAPDGRLGPASERLRMVLREAE